MRLNQPYRTTDRTRLPWHPPGRFQPGERVRSDYLGAGTIDRESPLQGYYMVCWDQDPPYDYNGGANPSIRPETDLTAINEGETDAESEAVPR